MRSHLKLHFEHNQKLIYGDNNDHENDDHDEKMKLMNLIILFFAFRGQKQLAHDRNLFDLFFVCIFNWDPFIFYHRRAHTHTQIHESYAPYIIQSTSDHVMWKCHKVIVMRAGLWILKSVSRLLHRSKIARLL